MFVGMHVMAASNLGIPELAIDMSEGEQFMKAVQNVLRHYSIETTQKTLDYVALVGCIGMIYGTRFGAYMIRKKEEAPKKRSGKVVQFPQSAETPAPQPSLDITSLTGNPDFGN